MFILRVLTLAALAAAAATYKCATLVKLDYAKYRGSRLGNGVDEFLGMRFAAPPLGDRRFRAPEDPANETAVQNATKVSLRHIPCSD